MKIRGDFEFLLFWLVSLINLTPIFSGKFFPTLDGPAHLYNANIINHLILDSDTVFHQLFRMNPEPVPNWTGHLILSLGLLIFPAHTAEKILLVICIMGLPLAFRRLLKAIDPSTTIWGFVVFPFTYSQLFLLGFYNFSLAIVLMLLSLEMIVRIKEFSRTTLTLLIFLMLLLYFSHVMIFLFTMGVAALWFGRQFLNPKANKSIQEQQWDAKQLLGIAKKHFSLIVCGVVFVLLSVVFFDLRGQATFSWNPLSKLLWNLSHFSLLFSLSPSEVELDLGEEFFALILGTVIVVMALRLVLWVYEKSRFQSNDFWLAISAMLLGLYFSLPDSLGFADFINVRVEFLFFLFLLIWMSTQRLPRPVVVAVCLIALLINFQFNQIYSLRANELSLRAEELCEISHVIDRNETVLPIVLSDDYRYINFSNYLGIEKPIGVLQNYEPEKGYFPVKWNHRDIPNFQLGLGLMVDDCVHNERNELNTSATIDHVLIIKGDVMAPTNCKKDLLPNIGQHYNITYNSKFAQLRSLKTPKK